jgi:hypothetical protein
MFFNISYVLHSILQMCHVFQQECRFREATEFMESCSPSWTECSSFMYAVLHLIPFLMMQDVIS